MAAYGAQLEQGKSEQQAEDYLSELFNNVPVQDKSAREALQTFVGGKGDVLLAYENEAITAQQKGQDDRLRRSRPDDPDPEPDRGHDRARRRRRRSSSTSLRTRRGAEDLRRQGLPPGDPEPGGQVEVPDAAAACSRSTKLGGWSAVNDKFFDPDNGSWRRSRRTWGSRPRSERRATQHRAPAGRGLASAAPVAARHSARGVAVALPEPDRADPAGRGRLRARPTAAGTRSGTRSPSPQAVAALKLTLIASLIVVAINAVDGHADRLGAGARRVPRQGVRQRADRPAVRAADDRGRADAAGPVRAARPGRHRRRLHAHRPSCWRCCS